MAVGLGGKTHGLARRSDLAETGRSLLRPY